LQLRNLILKLFLFREKSIILTLFIAQSTNISYQGQFEITWIVDVGVGPERKRFRMD
jgi:hypothetical protein